MPELKRSKLTFPYVPFPSNLIGVYVSLKPTLRALKAPENASIGDASTGAMQTEGKTGTPALELNRDASAGRPWPP